MERRTEAGATVDEQMHKERCLFVSFDDLATGESVLHILVEDASLELPPALNERTIRGFKLVR